MRRFMNGLLFGGLIGGIITVMANGNYRPQRKMFLGKTKKFSKRASKIVGGVTKDISKYMGRK